jgi:uncharacterized RDD family membrane protein YckC
VARTPKKAIKPKRVSKPATRKKAAPIPEKPVLEPVPASLPVPETPETKEIQGAEFGIRVWARLIDSLYLGLLGFVVGFFVGVFLVLLQKAGKIDPGWQAKLKGFNFISFSFGLVAGFFYHFFLEGLHGSSLGKAICRLRVIQEDGEPCGLKGALLRNVAYYWDSLFFGMPGYQSMQKSIRRQRYGDVWGKTIVVREENIPSGSQRSTARFLLAFFLASFAAGWIVALSLILRVLWAA